MRSLFSALLFAALPVALHVPHSLAAPSKATRATVAGGVRLFAGLSAQHYAVGEPISVALGAVNTTRIPIALPFTSGQRFDIRIFRANDLRNSVYSYSADKMFLQQLQTIALAPNKPLRFYTRIGTEQGTLAPGFYVLKANLTSSRTPAIASNTVRFQIVAPSLKPLAISARTDKGRYRVGETVRIDFTVFNPNRTPATVKFTSGQGYDVFVRNERGAAVWNDTANKRFIGIMPPTTFKPGERRAYSLQWNGVALPDFQVTPGFYSVEVVYDSPIPLVATPVRIEIQ